MGMALGHCAVHGLDAFGYYHYERGPYEDASP
jgi:hypothetical protein